MPRDAYGVLAFFDKTGLVEHQHAIGGAHLVGDDLMVIPPHLLFIPDHLTQKALQTADIPPWNLEGDGLNRLPFQWPQLAYHIVKEMGTRLTPGKTIVKEALELLQFVDEPGHIAGGEIKGGNRKPVACCPTRW